MLFRAGSAVLASSTTISQNTSSKLLLSARRVSGLLVMEENRALKPLKKPHSKFLWEMVS